MARVLIVEDEDSLRETLSRYLAHEGHEVIAAASGQEALDAGFDASPDVLIADWMLKNHIHGLHVSEVFRALHPRLNTILITGFPSRDLLEESDRCGVSRLLEKPFDLQELRDAVMNVLAEAPGDPVVAPAGPSIAALSVDAGGALQFASERATELLAAVGAPPGAAHLDEILAGEPPDVLEAAEREWVPVQSRHDPRQEWLLRSRRRPGRVGWLVVLCLRDEEQRRSDPRMRILLDERGGASGRSLEDPAPVVVIERDGVVRRLLVSQIERLGAICYPSDDLASALRLLEAEPRVRTVMVDFTLAGAEMRRWSSRIREQRPEATIVGTGGVGAESDLLAQGVARVLRKPWRINDLIAAIDP